jgi:transcriptional regulator with XRE-family HTH domain
MNENIVKKVCKELGLTYKELGEKIGYSEGAINKAGHSGQVSKSMQKTIELLLENLELKKQLNDCKTLRETLNSFLNKEDG